MSAAPGARPHFLRLRRFDRDVGLVFVAIALFIALENVAIGFGYRGEFASSWEMRSARFYLSPIALALAIPTAIALVAMARLAMAGRARAVAFLGTLAGAAAGVGVSTGRRMANLAVRAPFVVVVAVGVGSIAWLLARELPRLRASTIAWFGIATSLCAWLADAFVLPRLYPAFHLALFFAALMGCGAAASFVVRARFASALAWAGLVAAAASVAWVPVASVRVGPEDNLRRVAIEHAPLLGRAVTIANQVSPPPKLESDDEETASTLSSLHARKGARALGWEGHDIVLVTIDALRADHVSSYGYRRRTTPNIDALAARGARFEHAYCPTPHTSYSIASMMTGKYMKPLLALGAEDASETWAQQLRRYGYRTAAFYPPAVFYIDEHRFRRLRDENLGFEYKKEEFADARLRRAQIERYVEEAPRDKPLFLWVHSFEPHEPYEPHPEHPFEGDPRVDAYDSEIAAADALVGDIVAIVEASRPPGAVFIVSADHGEEHGEHGGRYHGTTVYEEQVRVPLVVVGPGITPRVVTPPVQTIDLLPTSLAALDVPVPPRLRGRDLGALLVGDPSASSEEGLAFAETDDYTLVARGTDRLVCARKIGSCTLFDVAKDPSEKSPVTDRASRVAELRKLTAAIERDTGKVEASGLPDALRRGMLGDRDAAEDVAALLDDARPDIRRLAARCAFKLRAPEIRAQLERAEKGDDDAEVRRWTSLALARMGDAPAGRTEVVLSLLAKSHPNADERAAAALALAEQGDARGEAELVARWSSTSWAETTTTDARPRGELDEAREILAAFARLRSKSATAALVRELDDVRLRPHLVGALAAIGDHRAKEPLLRAFAEERYVHLRAPEARALFQLGARETLLPSLTRFAGTPEPLAEAILVARDAGLLTPERGAWSPERGAPVRTSLATRLAVAVRGRSRILVLGAALGAGESADRPLTGSIGGVSFPDAMPLRDHVYVLEAGEITGSELAVALSLPAGIAGVWLVPRVEDIPPPAKAAWDAGTPDDESPPL